MTTSESKAVVYYFTGTGNSFKVAEEIAKYIDACTVDITNFEKIDTLIVDSDLVGFVFPLYDFKAPEYMQKFVSKLSGLKGKYLFAVSTFGIAPSKGMQLFKEDIHKAGGELSLGFAVQMPHNGIGSGVFSEKQHQQAFQKWDERKHLIFEAVKERKVLPVDRNNFGELMNIYLLQGMLFKTIPTLSRMLFKVARHGWESIAYTANDKCIGCGTCVKICPTGNITLKNGKPVWGDHCANCFACLQWCPQSAITLGNTNLNVKKYHHPDVSLSDILQNRTSV